MSNIKELVQARLEEFASQGGGQASLQISGPHGSLTSELLVVDKLGCAFTQMTYESSRLADADNARLTAVSEDLVRRMTYLLEPLGVVELDDESASIQLRSVPPAKEDGVIRYYELVVRRGGQITLQRFEKPQDRSADRRQITAEVTRDVFQRLAGDMEESLSESLV